MPNKLFQPFYDSMRMAIPLVMRKRELNAQKDQFDRRMKFFREKADREHFKNMLELEAGANEAKFRHAASLYAQALKNKFQPLAQAVGPILEKAGLPLPKNETTVAQSGLKTSTDLSQYLVPDTEPEKPQSRIGKLLSDRDALPEGDKRRGLYDQAISKLTSKSDSEERAVKTWVGPDGNRIFLPNNVTPPPGSKPYSTSGDLESRLNKSQELTSIRQDKRALRREIAKLRALPDLEIYRGQKGQISLMEAELNDLVSRENELLGKSKKKKTDGPSKLPDGLTENDIEFNMKKYGKTRQEVIERFMQKAGVK